MPLENLILLALIQGIAEFLPISSSAHLILFPALTGETDQGVAIDAAMHVGTLLAVMLYFRNDTAALVRGLLDFVRGRLGTPDARLFWLLALATVPVAAFGVILSALDLVDALRSPAVIAWTTILFAILLWVCDRWGAERQGLEEFTLRQAVAMGLMQAISLIPGTSRSGITMTTARALGFERVEAGRLSLLMSIPATMAVGGYLALELAETEDAALGHEALVAGGLAFVAALATLYGLMRMLRTWTFTPFVIYRLVLGAGLLIWVYA